MKAFLFAAILAMATAVPAVAGELVQNGGFETGDFTGWDLNFNTNNTGVDSYSPHTGIYEAYFGSRSDSARLSQELNTVAGQMYDISFYLKSENIFGGGPNSVTVMFGGQTLLALTDVAAFDYTEYSFLASASSLGTLSFDFRNDPSFFDLDDVSVVSAATAVPEPATWTIMLAAFGMIGFVIRRHRRQPQLAMLGET